MALAKYSLEIIQDVTVKNAEVLGNASARSAVVQAKSKTSGRIQEDEIFPVQWLTALYIFDTEACRASPCSITFHSANPQVPHKIALVSMCA